MTEQLYDKHKAGVGLDQVFFLVPLAEGIKKQIDTMATLKLDSISGRNNMARFEVIGDNYAIVSAETLVRAEHGYDLGAIVNKIQEGNYDLTEEERQKVYDFARQEMKQ